MQAVHETHALMIAVLLLAGCGAREPASSAQLKRVRASQFHMGMMVHLTVWAPTVEQGKQGLYAAFERIGQIDQIMSDYEPDSELSRLSRHAGKGTVRVSPELFTVLAAARQLAAWTEGLYDPTVGPLTQIWRQAKQENTPPDQQMVEAALKHVGYEKLRIEPQTVSVELTIEGMRLDLGGIAKGYAGDEAIRVLRERGLACAAYEAGGDKVFGDAPPGENGWQVNTGPGLSPLPPVANCAASISSDSVQYLEFDKQRLGHIIDTSTGWGRDLKRTCIVVASRGIDSDPLATIGAMMPEDAFREFLSEHFPTVRATVIETEVPENIDGPRIPPP